MMTRGRPLSRFLFARLPFARFLLGKAAQIAAILFALVLLTFLMVKMIPGDAASRVAGPDADAAYLSQLRSELGLDQPFAVQLWNYVAGVARGDFGVSLATRQPVIELIRDRLPYTAALAGLALAFVVVVGFSFGLAVAIATRDDRLPWLDHGFTIVTGTLGAIPELLAGIFLGYVFAVSLGWLPISGAAGPGSVILPALAIGLRPALNLARVVRVEARRTLRADFIRTARSKRLPAWRIYLRHLAPNVVTAALTIAGLVFPFLIGGAVIVENIFAWPGLGTAIVRAVVTADYPVVQAIVVLLGLLVLVTNMIVDVLLAIADPRSTVRT